MTPGSDHTNPRWLSAAFTALPILLSILYAVVASRPAKPQPTADAPASSRVTASR